MKRWALAIFVILFLTALSPLTQDQATVLESDSKVTNVSFSDLMISEDAWAESVSSGTDFSCMINQIGQVLCWGQGTNGALGTGSTDEEWTPTLTSSLGYDRTAINISAGNQHVCSLLDNGDVSCWGQNDYGQLGNGGQTDYNSPTLTSGFGPGRAAVAVSAGGTHTCAILDNGSVSCWG